MKQNMCACVSGQNIETGPAHCQSLKVEIALEVGHSLGLFC